MTEKGTLRQLYKQLSHGYGEFTYSAGLVDSVVVSGEGWEYIPQTTPEFAAIVNRTYIDMAGYTQDELTFFTQAVDFQKDKFPTAVVSAGTGPSSVYEYDLITTRRITNQELADISFSPPAFLPSTLDLMECVYGESRVLLQSTTIPAAFVPTFQYTFGSGNPTASDRLHWTRIILSAPSISPQVNPITVNATNTNLVVNGLTIEEKDLVYIERLRRAYTQQRSET